jgi:hypothetical protein
MSSRFRFKNGKLKKPSSCKKQFKDSDDQLDASSSIDDSKPIRNKKKRSLIKLSRKHFRKHGKFNFCKKNIST